MYSIILIDEDRAYQQAFLRYFNDSGPICCVAAVDNTAQWLEHYGTVAVQLIFMEAQCGGVSTIDSIPLIVQRMAPQTQLVMYSHLHDQDTIIRAFGAGATGYLLKGMPLAELKQQILAAISHRGALLSPLAAKRIIEYFPTLPAYAKPASSSVLNDKEGQIARMLYRGYTYEEVARQTNLSIDGVRYYVKNIYRKLSVKSKGELWRMIDQKELSEH